jgi:hypothetical protein
MRSLTHTERFQGRRRRRRYFEGWYFKCISADRRHAVAVIPGIASDPKGNRHAFIQIINAVSGKTYYFRFPYDQFESPEDRFSVRIGENAFDSSGLSLSLYSEEGSVCGQLKFANIRAFPVSRLRPGIMGPLTFVPFLECYHAIVHLSHSICGQITLDGESLDFTGGSGYIEKDYGRSFPRKYIWIQAGHFANGNAAFVFSRARIPFRIGSFTGFFGYFTDFRHMTLLFASYNGSRLHSFQVDPEAKTCSGVLTNRHGALEFRAEMSGGGRLRAPVDGLMSREIIESITALVAVVVRNAKGQILYEGQSGEAGMEIAHTSVRISV